MQRGKEFRWQFIKQSYADNKNINDESVIIMQKKMNKQKMKMNYQI